MPKYRSLMSARSCKASFAFSYAIEFLAKKFDELQSLVVRFVKPVAIRVSLQASKSVSAAGFAIAMVRYDSP